MNILFFADVDITTNRGGVNRVTHFLSRQFMEIPGWKCYIAYLYESDILPVSDFDGKLHLEKPGLERQLRDYIVQNDIDIVIVNLVMKQNIQLCLPVLYALSNKIEKLHIIFCFHTYPGFEIFGVDFKLGLYKMLYCADRITTLKKMTLALGNKTIFQYFLIKCLTSKYKFIYTHCDRLVLLSPHFIPIYMRFANILNNNKIISIPNPLPFKKSLSVDQLDLKKREVLIVSRLSEPEKRLSLAFKIWAIIEESNKFKDWKLIVVGNGEDETYYKKQVQKLNLRNISFEGRQNPIAYYERASIFSMTSRYEGWGLTLTESQQMGVVPVAFDSFEAIHDIIKDNYNGLIVPNNDVELFAQRLMWLMQHQEERRQMAVNGLQSCQQFSMENIVKKWRELFQELQHG